MLTHIVFYLVYRFAHSMLDFTTLTYIGRGQRSADPEMREMAYSDDADIAMGFAQAGVQSEPPPNQ